MPIQKQGSRAKASCGENGRITIQSDGEVITATQRVTHTQKLYVTMPCAQDSK